MIAFSENTVCHAKTDIKQMAIQITLQKVAAITATSTISVEEVLRVKKTKNI